MLSTLLFFLFGGAVVGETMALSMVISIAGSEILGKLYLVNGFLLFLLPPLFFNNIDRFNRGKLLSFELLFASGVLLVYLLFCVITGSNGDRGVQILLLGIYPLSYLTKIVLFLTFWTLANDVSYTREAKKEFPKIAAWGFIGGLTGAVLSRVLLEIVTTEMIIGLWMIAYIIAYSMVQKIVRYYRIRLLPKEQVPKQKREYGGFFADVKEVLSIELVRLIAVLYFLVFIAVFLVDYLFWHTCHYRFTTSRELASFQFSFYIIHGVVTIFGLLFFTPYLISKFGFTRLFSFLPFTLFCGSLLMAILEFSPISGMYILSGFITFQFMRYVVFENAFSPVYQMFFAAISKKQRGRAKTIIEGIIKPFAIIIAGVMLILLKEYVGVILILIFILAAVMIWVVYQIRIAYMNGLVPNLRKGFETEAIITEIGSHYDQKILSLMREYSHSQSPDVRCLAVRILAQLGSKQALKNLVSIFIGEKDEKVKELVARSLTNFYWYETKEFAETLLRDSNYRIRSNAIHSLNSMNCYWKWQLKDIVKSLLFENNIRVQIEAAQFLWQGNDRFEKENVLAFLNYLLKSKNENKRSAGVYLVSVLKPDKWQEILKNNLKTASIQVFTRSIEVILNAASKQTKLDTLQIVEKMSRRHIAIAGKAIQRSGRRIIDTVIAFIKHAQNRRMIFEMVHALRTIRDNDSSTIKKYKLDKETEQLLLQWINQELEQVYFNAYIWYKYRVAIAQEYRIPSVQLLEDALKEQLLRVCEWALDTMALLEPQGVIALGRKDLDIKELSQRLDMVEIVESFGANKLKTLIIPILEFESWSRIAKTGKKEFGFNEEIPNALRHFLKSENKWICLCTLYCIISLGEKETLLQKERSAIAAFTQVSYPYLADAAKQIVKTAYINEAAVDPFKLLETVLFLKKTVLFNNVPAERLMELAEISNLVVYKKGIVVSKEDDISDQLYIVKKGSLKIVKVKNTVKTILSIIRSGEAYGEIGLFNQSPRSASAVANEDSEVYVIQRSALKKLLLEIPEIAYNFLVIFSEKLRKNSEELTLLHTTLTGKNRKEALSGNNRN